MFGMKRADTRYKVIWKETYQVFLKEGMTDKSFAMNEKVRQSCHISGEETRIYTARRLKGGSNPTVYETIQLTKSVKQTDRGWFLL